MLVDQDNTAGLMFGTISAVDARTCRIRVRLDERDGMQTHWIHVPQPNTHRNKHRSLPDLGGHAAVMLAANGVDGLYMGSIYSGSEPPPIVDEATEFVRFADGTTVSQDRSTGRYCIDSSNSVTILAAQSVHIKGPAQVTVETADLIVTGNAIIQGQLIAQGGMAVQGGSGQTAAISGNVQIDGDVKVSGTVMDEGGNSNHHTH